MRKCYGRGMPKALEAAMLHDAHAALSVLERCVQRSPAFA